MTRIAVLNQRYAASASLARTGIEIVAVGDPAGARLSEAVRRLFRLFKEDGADYLEDLLSAAKALRWRRITQPQPASFNSSLSELASEVARHASRLRAATEDQSLLEELTNAATKLASTDSPVAPILLRSIEEVGPRAAIVVAASCPAAAGLRSWIQDAEVAVLTAGELAEYRDVREQTYVVGPPRFLPSSLVTAPVTGDVSFLLPEWFNDRSVPASSLAHNAEGAIRVRSRLFVEGEISQPERTSSELEPEDEKAYLPQPAWRRGGDDGREPTRDEVRARRVLLSGNLAMWLDDGERIRSLDPKQPVGERVTYTEIPAVREGTYLLLRHGETERRTLYQAAIAGLANGKDVERTQAAWKESLARRMRELGHGRIVRQFQDAGIKAVDRARAWTDPYLIRPASDQDFRRLLQWLEIPTQPTFNYATELRKSLYRVSASIGKQLEAAVATEDLSSLETTGHLSLEVNTQGFRGMLATRVLAISPFTEIVSRHDARVPFEDRSSQWLE